jgi:hypothetical protein
MILLLQTKLVVRKNERKRKRRNKEQIPQEEVFTNKSHDDFKLVNNFIRILAKGFHNKDVHG